MSQDHYKVLDVPTTATTEEIKKAYKKLALKWHPDRNPDNVEEATEKFKSISEAFEVLGNPENRANYDEIRSGRGGDFRRTNSRTNDFNDSFHRQFTSNPNRAFDMFNAMFAEMNEMHRRHHQEMRGDGGQGGNRGGRGDFMDDPFFNDSFGMNMIYYS
jgi:DnaJ-class molecular chaperone